MSISCKQFKQRVKLRALWWPESSRHWLWNATTPVPVQLVTYHVILHLSLSPLLSYYLCQLTKKKKSLLLLWLSCNPSDSHPLISFNWLCCLVRKHLISILVVCLCVHAVSVPVPCGQLFQSEWFQGLSLTEFCRWFLHLCDRQTAPKSSDSPSRLWCCLPLLLLLLLLSELLSPLFLLSPGYEHHFVFHKPRLVWMVD